MSWAHAGQGPSLQPRDVQLGKPTRAAIVSWSSSWKNRSKMTSLQLRQPRYQARQGQQILWLLPSLRLGDQVAQAAVGVVAHGLVQRQVPAGGHHDQRL